MDHIHNRSGLDYRSLQDQAAGNIDNSYSAATTAAPEYISFNVHVVERPI